jgi:hypothetical protein
MSNKKRTALKEAWSLWWSYLFPKLLRNNALAGDCHSGSYLNTIVFFEHGGNVVIVCTS